MNWEDNIKPRLINSKSKMKMDMKYTKPSTVVERYLTYFQENQLFCMIVSFVVILCIFRLHYVYTNKHKKHKQRARVS